MAYGSQDVHVLCHLVLNGLAVSIQSQQLSPQLGPLLIAGLCRVHAGSADGRRRPRRGCRRRRRCDCRSDRQSEAEALFWKEATECGRGSVLLVRLFAVDDEERGDLNAESEQRDRPAPHETRSVSCCSALALLTSIQSLVPTR